MQVRVPNDESIWFFGRVGIKLWLVHLIWQTGITERVPAAARSQHQLNFELSAY